jgi:hypothetical protein
MKLISYMFGTAKMSYLAQSDSILLFLLGSPSRDKCSLAIGHTWPRHMGYWGILSLLLHSSGTVLWNGLTGSRFSASPLYGEFLCYLGNFSLPRDLVIKVRCVLSFLDTRNSGFLSVGCNSGKTCSFPITNSLQSEKTLLSASPFSFSASFLLAEIAHLVSSAILCFWSVGDFFQSLVLFFCGLVCFFSLFFCIWSPVIVLCWLFAFLLFSGNCCQLKFSRHSLRIQNFRLSRMPTIHFNGQPMDQAVIKSKHLMYTKYLEVANIAPSKDFCDVLLRRLSSNGYRITPESAAEFLAAVGNKDKKDWGRLGSSLKSKTWVFTLAEEIPFVLDDVFAESSWDMPDDTPLFCIYSDFDIVTVYFDAAKKITVRMTKAVTAQPIGARFAHQEGDLLCRFVRIDANGRLSPGDFVLSVGAAVRAALLGAGLGHLMEYLDVRWVKVFAKRTEEALLKEVTKKKAVKLKQAAYKKSATPEAIPDVFEVAPDRVVHIRQDADCPQKDNVRYALYRAFCGDIRGNLNSELEIWGYRCAVMASEALGQTTRTEPLECYPYGVVVAVKPTSLIHFLLILTDACGIKKDYIKGIICTNRPDTPNMRATKNVMCNVGIIVSNDSVLAHISKALVNTQAWQLQLYASVVSTFLTPRGIFPALHPSLLPVPNGTVLTVGVIARSHSAPLRDTSNCDLVESCKSLSFGLPTVPGDAAEVVESDKARVRRERKAAMALEAAPTQVSPPSSPCPSDSEVAAALATMSGLAQHDHPALLNHLYTLMGKQPNAVHILATLMADLVTQNPQAALNILYTSITTLTIDSLELTRQTLSGVIPRGDGNAMDESNR